MVSWAGILSIKQPGQLTTILSSLEHRAAMAPKILLLQYPALPRKLPSSPWEKGTFVPFSQIREVVLQRGYSILRLLWRWCRIKKSHVEPCSPTQCSGSGAAMLFRSDHLLPSSLLPVPFFPSSTFLTLPHLHLP